MPRGPSHQPQSPLPRPLRRRRPLPHRHPLPRPFRRQDLPPLIGFRSTDLIQFN